jgi:hypothetical protein
MAAEDIHQIIRLTGISLQIMQHIQASAKDLCRDQVIPHLIHTQAPDRSLSNIPRSKVNGAEVGRTWHRGREHLRCSRVSTNIISTHQIKGNNNSSNTLLDKAPDTSKRRHRSRNTRIQALIQDGTSSSC